MLTPDVAVDQRGAVYITAHTANEILRSPPGPSSNDTEFVAGCPGCLDMSGITACAFGRTPLAARTLYVVTEGGQFAPINGTFVEPAKVVAVDLTCN